MSTKKAIKLLSQNSLNSENFEILKDLFEKLSEQSLEKNKKQINIPQFFAEIICDEQFRISHFWSDFKEGSLSEITFNSILFNYFPVKQRKEIKELCNDSKFNNKYNTIEIKLKIDKKHYSYNLCIRHLNSIDNKTSFSISISPNTQIFKNTIISNDQEINSKNILFEVIKSMPVMLNAIDQKGNFVIWNDESEKVTGYNESEILNSENAWSILYPDSEYRNKMFNQWQEKGNNYKNWEWELIAKNGQKKHILWSNISDINPIQGWKSWGIGIDITDTRFNNLRLKESEQLLSEAERIGKIGSWKWDLKNNNFSWSDGNYRLFDLEIGSFQSTYKDYLDLIIEEDREYTKQILHRLYLDHKQITWEYKIQTKKNEIKYIRSSGNIYLNANNEAEYIIGIGIDITELRKADDAFYLLNKELEARVEERTHQLREANKEKDEILGIAAHDLKSPLHAILLQVGLAKMMVEMKQQEKAISRLNDIEDDVRRMSDIISNILEISKIETGNIRINKSKINISLILDDLIQTYSDLANKKSIQIQVEIDARIRVETDKHIISQIFENLISNAIKFSNENTIINVKLKKNKNGSVVFDVEDQGLGMSQEDMTKLYTKFARLSAKPTGDENSTGLGLYILKKFVELLGGSIQCTSQIGKGTKFIVELNF